MPLLTRWEMRLELSQTQNVPGFLSCLLPECGLSWPHTLLSCLCRFLALCGVSALPKCIWVLLALWCHQSCWNKCPPPAFTAIAFSAPKAEHTLLLPLHQCPPLQHKWLFRPQSPGQLAEGTCTAAFCHFQPKQQSQDSDWQRSKMVNIWAQLYPVLG